LNIIHENHYINQTNRRKAGVQHKRIKFPVLKWATFLVMETVCVHILYPPFGCNQHNKTNRSNEVEKKGVLSSMIDARLEKLHHGEMHYTG
jgi:hypothetical protein